ncbi:DUF1775 domain-containing protein [Microbacterium sp. 4R-513]|uniref:DUF1775 domain-containing protein n=1 Tax=Microbacterium sp. 4R-513 TaxID=2567934 RepID=UPI0013E1C552|nr:DUF1775 domain-containing protein [Microbacterium sp. 4R-513]QIG38180.1 DUF1775 domain-containing protein [Microbacterium sp. 4R-513]
MNHSSQTPHLLRRRTAVVLGGLVAGAALAMAAPLAASAHVHVDPATAEAGTPQTLTFSFAHGCEGSPTSAIVIDIPETVATTTPVSQGGWTIQRDLGPDEQPTRVTFTADTSVESGIQASVALVITFSEEAAYSDVAFPVTQECVTGSTAWTEVATDGADPETLEAPAPVVAVGAVAEAEEHGQGTAPQGDSTDGEASAATAPAATDVSTADPVARGMAGGALVAGLAALVVLLVRGRRQV